MNRKVIAEVHGAADNSTLLMTPEASLSQLHSDAVSNILTPSLANPDGVASISDASGVKDKILAAQSKASKVENVPIEMLRGLDQQMEKNEDGGLYFMDRIWVPLVGSVRTLIMDEVHALRYSVHPGADKMYYDLRDMYWWPAIKNDIATYVSKCLTCSKVKAEHHRPSSLLQQLEILEWK
ncbi:putative reverse transcriptase domain-containing protein [Tanacetum coccineum]